MKPKDIIIGKKYKHSDFPNTEYLGIGIDGGPKFLLVLEKHYKNNCLLVVPPEKYKLANTTKKGMYEWWSKFSPIGKKR